MNRVLESLVVLASTASVALAEPLEWPEWRGPGAQGHAPDRGVALHWSDTQNVTWKTPIPGRGWSSPVIAGDQIWLTTALETEASAEDAARRLLANTGDQPLTLMEAVEYRAVCVSRESGRILRDISLFTEREPQWVHRLNSYASPTPVLEPGRLYAHFGASGTVCLDTASGELLWRNSDLKIQHENGPGSSPILWRNLVIVHMDGSDLQYVVALDKHSGQVVWKTDRTGSMHTNPQLKKSYATPLVIEVEGRETLISPGPNWLYAYDPATGRELWKLDLGTLSFSLSARPVVGHGMIYLSTGYLRPELLAIRYGGGAEPSIAWRYTRGVPTMPSPVIVGEELYFVSDSGGLLTCLDAKTGREHYRERLGGDHSASLLHADGRIYIPGRNGTTAVVRPGTTFHVLARNELPDPIMASKAVADGALFLRTAAALYRIEDKTLASTP
ncbi:MAG: PQQ-binding-like beta-propeller repeat protein [Verrucomicrobiae bacterium]|nr:PQQ-binding-like beta-propeller repeat protein [Verrucomicrobiae bacterium]